jgi:hypothetical protein
LSSARISRRLSGFCRSCERIYSHILLTTCPAAPPRSRPDNRQLALEIGFADNRRLGSHRRRARAIPGGAVLTARNDRARRNAVLDPSKDGPSASNWSFAGHNLPRLRDNGRPGQHGGHARIAMEVCAVGEQHHFDTH